MRQSIKALAAALCAVGAVVLIAPTAGASVAHPVRYFPLHPYKSATQWPDHVAVDESRKLLFVSDYNVGFGDTIEVMDQASGAWKKQLLVGAVAPGQNSSNTIDMAYDVKRGALWILTSGTIDLNLDGGTHSADAPPALWKVDARTLTAAKVKDFTGAHDPTRLTVDDRTGAVWLSGETSSPFIGRLDPTSRVITYQGLAEAPTALVANPSAAGVDALMPAGLLPVSDTLAVAPNIPLPSAPTAAVANPTRHRLYITDGENALWVVNTATRSVTHLTTTTGPVQGMAFDSRRGRLFLTGVVNETESTKPYTRLTVLKAATGAIRSVVKIKPYDANSGFENFPIAVGSTAARAYVVMDRLAVVTPPGNRATKRPAIRGHAVVAQRLTATTGSWVDAPSKYAYRWMRNGKAIGGATRAHYIVREADRGSRLSVRVTASLRGDRSTSTSKPTGKVHS